MAKKYQSRYVAYARAEGFDDPGDVLTRDREKYPGGCMAGFIVWITGKLSEWRKIHALPPESCLSESDHVAFDAWLGAESA